ncbi:spore germination protein [Paenibacillus sp. N3.4]|uniref:spore germination protein n=1 Tax=Paenibacillus sp. N3.4 TaxID=2603222 RepID=UPI0011CA54BB|nr:spore germination protein [Paenibacillus sp. N3.4]TXK72241.1 spore germination protein [Paenibacillus sp. N3.4]
MPSFVGVLNVIRNEGTLVTGDTLIIAPKTATKSYAGGGGGITGDFTISTTVYSATVTFDPDGIEAVANKVGTIA